MLTRVARHATPGLRLPSMTHPSGPTDSTPTATPDPSAAVPASASPEAPRVVTCAKFGKPMEGLAKAPLKGELGQRVFETVSKEAWRMWLEHSKMLINEYRLDLLSEQGQKVWMTELEKFMWGEGSQLPPDFQPGKGGGHSHGHSHG